MVGMRKKLTRKKLKEKLDREFSRYVRLRDADEQGNVTCFTCGDRKHWKNMHAGHFQSRTKHSVRWDVMNVKPQCPRCNLFNHGEQYVFGRKLDEIYGEGTAERITRLGNAIVKHTDADYEELAQVYKEAAAKLETKVR